MNSPVRKKDKEILPALVGISKKAGKAIMDFGLIDDGDKVIVAVSGGKDSLSLLHVLRDRQRMSPIHFDVLAVHIDFGFPDFDPAQLFEYFKKHEFDYIVEKVDALKGESYDDIDCFRWSKHRRKALFQVADREGCSKIAFGHHLDDIAETIILNQFYKGEISAMKPKQELFGGKITIIRPLTYVREDSMVNLAKELGIASMGQSKCANDDTSHRMKIKKMLREIQAVNPSVVKNIFKSLQNIKPEYLIEKPISYARR